LHLIVGVDPGTTTGIAALNFRGDLVDLFSSKDLGIPGVIAHLIRLGRVSVIASDVKPAPAFVSKLAAQLGALVHTPHEPLSVSEKIELTRDFKTEDSHQRDALAAALTTLNRFRNKFQKIDSLNLGDNIKHLVLQGYSIDKAVKTLEGGEKPEPVEKPKPGKETVLLEGDRRLRRLEKQNKTLRNQLEEKERGMKKLKDSISEIKTRYRTELGKETEIRGRDQRIEGLERSLNNLRSQLKEIDELRILWRLLSEGSIKPIGVFPERYKGLTLVNRRLKKRDLENLGDIEGAFLSRSFKPDPLLDRNILVADTEYVREKAGVYYITVDDLRRVRSRKPSLEEIVEDYRRKRPS
jgi:predicted RNase H-like nuclease (RuvC/YqgF family)